MSKVGLAIDLVKFKISQRLEGSPISDTPWFDPETLEWFKERLPRAKSYLEFGSGGSTVMAAKLGIPTISIEGDDFFARQVREKVGAESSVTVIRPPIGMTGLWGVPVPGSASSSRVQKWRTYVDLAFTQLAREDRPFPDFILVDGRFRAACALRSTMEAKAAGAESDVLIDDYYSEGRSHYTAIEELLGHPERIGRSALFRTRDAKDIPVARIEQAVADWR